MDTPGKYYLRIHEMKNKSKTRLLASVIVALFVVVLWQAFHPRVRVVRESVVRAVPVEVRRRQPVEREQEFRRAPIKRYKPGIFQQMGILKSGDGEILPLYGREVDGRRDRYHYYTTTSTAGGSFSLPVKAKGRDCMDDVGCEEQFSGGEPVAVEGKDGQTFGITMYRTDDFFTTT